MRRVRRNLLLTVVTLASVQLAFAGPAFGTDKPRTAHGPKWVPREIIVKFKDGVSRKQVQRINQRQGTAVLYTSPFARFHRISVPPGKAEQQMVKIYKTDPAVEYAELNYYGYAFFVPNDPLYGYQWHLYDPVYGGINMQSAWDITTGEPNVIVAVLDTGIAYENYRNYELCPDLVNTRFVPGYDFVNQDEHANDDNAHGTHVTGTIAQSTDNNYGMSGVAFNCSIMPVKVLDKHGEGSYSTIADGIYFAADNGAIVINMSLGGPSDSTTLRDAVEYAYNKGATIVCSAGNKYEEGNPPQYPAAYNQFCVAVGATKYDQTRAYYSNTGSYLDVAAPGGDLDYDQNGDGEPDGILQQTFGDRPKGDWGWWFYIGTSMSAAHVSGAAALIASAGITDPNEVREALENSAVDLGSAGWDAEYGFGIIDAYAALNYCSVTGDLTGDRSVNLEDLVIFTGQWLLTSPPELSADFNDDQRVDFLDFAELAPNWTN